MFVVEFPMWRCRSWFLWVNHGKTRWMLAVNKVKKHTFWMVFTASTWKSRRLDFPYISLVGINVAPHIFQLCHLPPIRRDSRDLGSSALCFGPGSSWVQWVMAPKAQPVPSRQWSCSELKAGHSKLMSIKQEPEEDLEMKIKERSMIACSSLHK